MNLRSCSQAKTNTRAMKIKANQSQVNTTQILDESLTIHDQEKSQDKSQNKSQDKQPINDSSNWNIFHSEKKKLKRELIDASKALEVMKTIKNKSISQEKGHSQIEIKIQKGDSFRLQQTESLEE